MQIQITPQPPHRPIRNQKGQGLIEYLIIVALVGVAAIAIMRSVGQTVNAKFASISYALRGERKSVEVDRIDESLYRKKDLSDFMNGVGSNGSK